MNVAFHSPFAKLITDFVAFKRSLGFKYVTETSILKKFDEFCVKEGVQKPSITKELMDRWCQKKPYESGRNTHQQRISCIRQFSLYLITIGYDAYIPVNLEYIRQRKSPYVAYIFTHDEMNTILKKSNQIYPHRRSTMHLVIPVLIRLLYCTGIRIMEALNLKLENVDLVNGLIYIENAKFNKDRQLPISESMLAVLNQYCSVMHPNYLPEDYLFIGITGEPCSHHNIYLRFRELLVQSRIQHAGRGYGPRIHDIRHTYCCHTLQKSVKAGSDLTNMLPLLSIYLGHESITATSQYLKMTAEVYPEISDAVSSLCAYVIPEVSK